jgi:hypothetical protein
MSRPLTTRFADFRLRPRPATSARGPIAELPAGLQKYLEGAKAALAEPFRGITAAGHVSIGLYPIQKTGVSTEPIRVAAESFLAALTPDQRTRSRFSVDGLEWRQWSNIHPYLLRHGVCLDELAGPARERALAVLAESLSLAGYGAARAVMRLNEVIGGITTRPDEYGEWLYWISVMGTPSADQPWGWQIDGHHLIVNCFVLGDQVVMTPLFMGSEPVAIEEGEHAGTRVFEVEERDALALMRALGAEHRARAVLSADLPGEVFTAAFRDNFEMRFEGVRYGELGTAQQRLLLGLIETYVGRIRPGHAAVKMEEVRQHLSDTHFAWIGGVDEDSVFYYRLHSPVLLVEFDHQRGIALDNDEPSRNHIHTVIRTPNGNDYGRDLLRQHHAQVDHARPGHRHSHAG